MCSLHSPGCWLVAPWPCVGCSSDARRLGRLECAFLSHRLPVALSSRPQEAGALLGVGVVLRQTATILGPSVSEKGLERI